MSERGVTSDGVTVTYRAEAATMTDNSPTLTQPVITARRWDAFVPYSWEVGADWPGNALQNELVRLIADARDVNDTSVFWGGTSSSNQPAGLMTSLGTSQQVITSATATYAPGDAWALKAAIPPRFMPNTTFAAPPAIWDRTYRLVPNASTAEPALMEGRDGPFLGRPIAEWSFNAGTSVATGGTLMVGGDFSNYVIADRLGLTAIPIPVLFSGNTADAFGYPTGQSGLAVWGRTGAGCINPNAFRVLTSR
jgi:HK97 family phage major capsid protein